MRQRRRAACAVHSPVHWYSTQLFVVRRRYPGKNVLAGGSCKHESPMNKQGGRRSSEKRDQTKAASRRPGSRLLIIRVVLYVQHGKNSITQPVLCCCYRGKKSSASCGSSGSEIRIRCRVASRRTTPSVRPSIRPCFNNGTSSCSLS